VTTYTASYAEHPRYLAEGSTPTTFDLTLTFTANDSSDLFRVDSSYIEHTPSGEDRPGTIEECIIFYEYLSALRDYELRAISVSHGTFNHVIFNVERVLLP